MNLFIRSLATVLVAALVGLFAFLGCILIGRGLGAVLGAFLVGRHAFVAIAIMILLGVLSLAIATGMCLGLPLIWSSRRPKWPVDIVPHAEVCVHFLGHQGCPEIGPIHSGFHATFRCHEVVDEVAVVLVGVSQLASDQKGTARLSFSNPTGSLAALREGLEFDILDREKRYICRGVISEILRAYP